MANDKKGWRSGRSGAKDGAVEASKDLLRKARAVNPSLAEQGSTTELFMNVQAAKAKPAASTTKPAATKGGGQAAAPSASASGGDFFTAFYARKQHHQDERERLTQELARVDRELATLGPSTAEALVELLLAADPGVANPQTLEILQREKAFLDRVGFSQRQLVERRLQEQKK
ncbi:MAG: hypothetical protein IT381_01375 [Deltaproteobacteria bacterium]|nr:hypothetical protein [Deltaproteobacteria bacterium]